MFVCCDKNKNVNDIFFCMNMFKCSKLKDEAISYKFSNLIIVWDMYLCLHISKLFLCEIIIKCYKKKEHSEFMAHL